MRAVKNHTSNAFSPWRNPRHGALYPTIQLMALYGLMPLRTKLADAGLCDVPLR